MTSILCETRAETVIFRDPVERRIYRFDLVNELYDSYIDVPQSGMRKETVGGMELEVPAPSYEMVSTKPDTHLFGAIWEKWRRGLWRLGQPICSNFPERGACLQLTSEGRG